MSSDTCSDSTNQTRELPSSYIFYILQHFATKLCNFTNFRTFFNAVVMNFTISIFSKILSIMQMKESGLLHCLPVPIFQIQAQVCFIHSTLQEFLAARHIVETKGPQEIKEFISSYGKHGIWHLVTSVSCWVIGKENENV